MSDLDLALKNKKDFTGFGKSKSGTIVSEKLFNKDLVNLKISNNIQELQAVIKEEMNEGSSVRFLSNVRSFSSLDFIDFICVVKGKIINELIITTFRVGPFNLEHIAKLFLKGKIIKVIIYTSKLKADLEETKNLIQTCEKYGWQLRMFHNHSKLILMNCKNLEFYTLETSANFNPQSKTEQFCFTRSEKIFNFYKNSLSNLLPVDIDSKS